MAQPKPVPETVEKIMSIKLSEFEAGLKRIDPAAPSTYAGGTYRITGPGRITGAGSVMISFEKLEPAVLGGLMHLPRAKVTLDFSQLDVAARADFISYFDQTFQRGGG